MTTHLKIMPMKGEQIRSTTFERKIEARSVIYLSMIKVCEGQSKVS